MTQLLWIFAWIGAGYALKRIVRNPRALKDLNRFIIWVSLPATVLLALHRLSWDPSYWVPISMAWIVFAASAIVFVAIGKRRSWSPQTIGALILTAGLGNTSFVGFPLLRAIYGEHAISIAILNDQPGSFLVLSTLGIYAASYFSARRSSPRALLTRIIAFPPVWATLLALALRPVEFAGTLTFFLGLAAKTLIPLALISVGTQLEFGRKQFERELTPLFFGLLFKLVLAPLLIFVLFVLVLRHSGESMRVTLLESAMGPMITGAIVAREYDLDPPLCSLMVSAGIPLCLISVPLIAKILELLKI